MIKKSLKTPDEVINAIPELKAIKRKMEKVEYLSFTINSKIQNPVPAILEIESLHIQELRGKIYLLRKEVREDLEGLAKTNPSIASEGEFK